MVDGCLLTVVGFFCGFKDIQNEKHPQNVYGILLKPIFASVKKGESCVIHELSHNRDLCLQKVGSPNSFAI